ncbi:hypothetical protein ACWD6I_00420 [Streptomyces sp. NPDC002454]
MTSERLEELRDVLNSLARWSADTSRWEDAQVLAGRATPLVWEELREREVWHELEPADRAALYWCLHTGHRINVGVDPGVRDWRPLFAELSRECAYFASRCTPGLPGRWPEARHRVHEHTEVVPALLWYRSLPTVWRPEVFRALESGPRTARGSGGEPPSLWDVLSTVQRSALHEDAPQREGRQAAGDGIDTADLFDSLPEGWQLETVRRLAAGRRPRRTVTTAREVIAGLPLFGVRLLPAPPP